MAKKYSITSKNQVTIPQEVREELALEPNDKITYHKEGKRYYITKAPAVMSIEELQAANQRWIQEKGIKPATDADIKHAREKLYGQGGTW